MHFVSFIERCDILDIREPIKDVSDSFAHGVVNAAEINQQCEDDKVAEK